MSKLAAKREQLDKYYKEVSTIILARQNPATGLIPASVAVTAHGDYRDAWVRDNVYSILAVWGLALAYRRLDDEEGRAYELEHATIKCMRGLLYCMMRQAPKVELFKNTQSLDHALHAKYNTANGDTVVGDRAWGHLQIDATSIFLLYLAQMTVSGFKIIFTLDEVNFVQNLVFYIERAYRTPDYGIWERGNKINHGEPELNCSSIGMVVAALQAINGVNLFGSRGGVGSVIHVLPDEITRNYTTLHSSLPRESGSKEIDAALLAVISFPAFAVADKSLIDRTRNEILKKLGGRYGMKRFLRDGHQTVLEDSSRLHYEPHELTKFENVESEWPLFFTYMVLDGQFRGDLEQSEHYLRKLNSLAVDSSRMETGFKLIPELYIVPREAIEREKQHPGSQERVPNENIPLVWAQSLYILGNLINDNHLSPADLDPLGRRLLATQPKLHYDTVVQIVLLSESPELQAKLRTYGLETNTVEDCEPFTISQPSALRDAYSFLGRNEKIGLTGRPDRPMGTLATCKLYKCQGRIYAFLPHFMDRGEYYLVSDNDYLVSFFEQEIAFVRNHWMFTGRPTMCVMLTSEMIGAIDGHPATKDTQRWRFSPSSSRRNLMNFMMSLRSSGVCNGVRVRVGRLSEMVNTACVESMDFLVESDTHNVHDWHGILRGQHTEPKADVLKMEQEIVLTPGSTRGRSVHKRKSMRDNSLATPLIAPREPFLLREHQESQPSNIDLDLTKDPRSLSPQRTKKRGASNATKIDIPDDNDVLSLTLGDPKDVPKAMDLLRHSANLYDQVDLLHYLQSTVGLEFEVPGLSRVEHLLEEVYTKATQLREWSVSRCIASLLKKTINSLTSNLTDLLVRQKPITVGVQPREVFINNPKNPQELSNIIYDNCSSDPREASLVQEVITYLGSFIKSMPGIFDGIMRIRTHFFIIALREEVSTIMRCDEAEALEHLMDLSPFEMKSLMRQVLTAGDHCGPISHALSPAKDWNAQTPVAKDGPTEVIQLHCDLAKKRELLPGAVQHVAHVGSLGSIMPSGGRWIRRRKNDGAVNRVPSNFYPQVWKVLSKTKGINVGSGFLPSDPTISVSTPEEFNFALQVENLLDNFRDPAERQVAVECLVVISRVEERNPEIELTGASIDLPTLIREAVGLFWVEWVSEQSHNKLVSKDKKQDPQMQKAIDAVIKTPLGNMFPDSDPGDKPPIGLSAVQFHAKQVSAQTTGISFHSRREASGSVV
ncbi:glycosyl hydrolases family 15-domain-containing protein [Gorgonomyces haynaldii]|nr:glycosyl hydrolases family 15-domain-containing protein [Gorgonomyces haynaldii]